MNHVSPNGQTTLTFEFEMKESSNLSEISGRRAIVSNSEVEGEWILTWKSEPEGKQTPWLVSRDGNKIFMSFKGKRQKVLFVGLLSFEEQ